MVGGTTTTRHHAGVMFIPDPDDPDRYEYDMSPDEIANDIVVCRHGHDITERDHWDCKPWGTVEQYTALLLGGNDAIDIR